MAQGKEMSSRVEERVSAVAFYVSVVVESFAQDHIHVEAAPAICMDVIARRFAKLTRRCNKKVKIEHLISGII